MSRYLQVVFICLLTADSHIMEQIRSFSSNEDMSSHIGKCCFGGLNRARIYNNCDSYQYEVLTIPPLWRGLCHSTYGLCCSREMVKQVCTAGRLAALTGSRCDELNNTSTYADCCRSCQVGLAVKASSKTSCNDPLFKYFAEMESYRICCARDGNNDINEKVHTKPVDENEIDAENKTDIEDSEEVTGEESQGTIILEEDDDDICGKVKNLCAQICENTKEAYRCKCNAGFQLDPNNVTCSPLNNSVKDSNEMEEDNEQSENIDEMEEHSSLAEDGNELKCQPGYQLDLQRSRCTDIDECFLKLDNCKPNQYCHNINGNFRCLDVKSKNCKPGFRFSFESESCEDINDCDSSPCESGYVCINLEGHYECKKREDTGSESAASSHLSKLKCRDGFTYINDRCVDIDECKNDETACDSTQICTNDNGGYHCDCKLGFNLDTTTNACVDINECSINNHNCLPTQRCDNTVGSYICTRLQSCGTGYTLNAETGNCDDDDECSLNTHNCTPDYECFNTKGSFRCYRRQPTTISTTTTTTTTSTKKPIITSKMPSQNAGPFRNRSNQEFPSYSSSYDRVSHRESTNYLLNKGSELTCSVGFYRNYLGACVDLNECALSSPCGSHQRCINTNGSYRCQNLLQCSAGYRSTPDGTQCIDIDECENGEHNCASNQICRNRIGGFVCACPPGHQLLPRTHTTGPSQCVDINECAQEHPMVCASNAQCVNTLGSYYCECKSGYQKSRDNDRICLDVDECQEIPGLCQQKCVNFWGGYRCTCNTGYELSVDNRTCNDIDECEVHKSYKLCMGFCNNVPGSYECSCPRGYTLATDKTTCRDIDECASGEFCTGRNDVCTNIRGSHRCTTIHCPYGYINDPDQKNRCRQSSNYCEGDDCYNKPSAYTYNFITLVSKLLIPPEGRVIFSLRGPLLYDEIDFDLKILKIQAAANIEKARDNHFDMIKGRHEVHVSLKRSLEGPQDIELELSMTVFTHGLPRGKSVAKIFILVSQYTF